MFRHRLRNYTATWLLVIACGVILGAFGWFSYSNRTYSSFIAVGPVQILGGPDEVWFFLEKTILVRRQAWSEPSVIAVGHIQEVVVITVHGVKKRIIVADKSCPTFHPNIGRVFYDRSGFCIIQGESMLTQRSMFRWKDDHFELMPLRVSEEMLKEMGLADCRLPEFDPKIDNTSESNYWKVLHRASSRLVASEGVFSWRHWQFALRYEKAEPLVRLTVSATGPGDPWQAVLYEFDATPKDITARDYNELCNTLVVGHKKRQ